MFTLTAAELAVNEERTLLPAEHCSHCVINVVKLQGCVHYCISSCENSLQCWFTLINGDTCYCRNSLLLSAWLLFRFSSLLFVTEFGQSFSLLCACRMCYSNNVYSVKFKQRFLWCLVFIFLILAIFTSQWPVWRTS